LSDEQKRQIDPNAQMLQMKRGQPVYLPGDPSDFVYVVKSGAVKIVGKSPEGGEVILGILTPGDLFGELALTGDEEPQEHRAEAMDDTLLCQLPRDLLMRMSRENPAFGMHVTKLIGFRLRTLRTRVAELLGKSAPARLAHTLLELGRQHGIRDNGGVLIPLRLSQGDLGKLVGLTRETVNGILQAWRDQGLVEMDRRCVRLRDSERLRRVK
jgi:CRP/FNR family transcriptional regulator